VKHTFLFTLALLTLTLGIAPTIEAKKSQWSYGNYLYDLVILSFDNLVEAGRMNSITVQVASNTEVAVHVEFKGHYSWGEWVYYSEEIQFGPGETEFTAAVEIPFKTIVEPTCDFYYYVYVTFPGEQWVSHCWGLATDVEIVLPPDISLDDLHEMMSHLAWMVESSDLPDVAKRYIVSRIEGLSGELVELYLQGEVERIYEILEFILDIRNSFCSNEMSASNYWLEIAECARVGA